MYISDCILQYIDYDDRRINVIVIINVTRETISYYLFCLPALEVHERVTFKEFSNYYISG